jgi:hypothetical protein
MGVVNCQLKSFQLLNKQATPLFSSKLKNDIIAVSTNLKLLLNPVEAE